MTPVQPNRSNSDFQIEYFLASGGTPDSTWCFLRAQADALELSLKVTKIGLKRKLLTYKTLVQRRASFKSVCIELEATLLDLEEADLAIEQDRQLIQGRLEEIAFLKQKMDEIEPQCVYSDLPLAERFRISQREGWAVELQRRAAAMVMKHVTGIDYDHLLTMIDHPDFKEKIFPVIQSSLAAAASFNKDMQSGVLTYQLPLHSILPSTGISSVNSIER